MNKMSRRKIAIVGPKAPPYGGMSVLVDTLRMGLDVYCDIVIVNTNANIAFLNMYIKFKKVMQFFLYLFNLRKLFICDAVLIVSSSGVYFYIKVIPALLICNIIKIPVVIDFVGGDILNKIEKGDIRLIKWLKLAEFVLVPATIFKSKFQEFGLRSIVFPHIVNVNRFFVSSDKKYQYPVFLAAKNLFENSNVISIIKAFEIIKAAFHDSKLLIAGDGPQKEYLQNYVFNNQIEDVSFLGNVSYSEMPTIFSQASVFLHATKTESFGIVLVEAMAAGLPIISSDVGGIPDLIKNGFNGVLVGSEDYKTMANSAIELWNNKEKFNELRRNGLVESKKYSISALSKVLFDIVEDVINVN